MAINTYLPAQVVRIAFDTVSGTAGAVAQSGRASHRTAARCCTVAAEVLRLEMSRELRIEVRPSIIVINQAFS